MSVLPPTEQMPPVQTDGVSAIAGDSLYAWGGTTQVSGTTLSGDSVTNINLTSLAIAAITPSGPKPPARQNGCAAPLTPSSFLIFGGNAINSSMIPDPSFDDIWLYDTTSRTWTNRTVVGGPAFTYADCATIGQTVYVSSVTAELWALNTGVNPYVWTPIVPPPGANPTIVPLLGTTPATNHGIYAVGKYLVALIAPSPTSGISVFTYDTTTNQWVPPPNPLPPPYPNIAPAATAGYLSSNALLSPNSSGAKSSSFSTAAIIGISVGGFVVLVGIVVAAVFLMRAGRRGKEGGLGSRTVSEVTLEMRPPTNVEVVASCNFTGEQEDELDLITGDIIQVIGEFEDG
ncbi:hypothetical protein BDK51DRAFT_32706, partial [Blyttiomyces helicus]